MRIALHFIKKNILTNLYYRFNFVGMLLILIVAYTTKLIFLDSLFQFSGTIAGWDKPQLMFLLYTMIMSLLITDSFDTSILRFFQKIYYGEGDVYFIKPVSLLYYIFFAWVKTPNLIPVLIMGGGGTYYFYDVFASASFLSLLLYFISLIVGIITNILLITNLCSLTFIVKRQIPADFLFSELTKIMVLPFGVFSRKIGMFLLLMLPSIFSAAIPSAIIIKENYLLLLIQSIAGVLTFIVFYLFYKFSLQKYEGLGG